MGSGARLKRLLGQCWRCFAWAAIAAAVLLTLLRLALPWLSGYRDELAEAVTDYIEAPVRIEGLSVAWRGLGPQLELKGVRVGAPQGEGLERIGNPTASFETLPPPGEAINPRRGLKGPVLSAVARRSRRAGAGWRHQGAFSGPRTGRSAGAWQAGLGSATGCILTP